MSSIETAPAVIVKAVSFGNSQNGVVSVQGLNAGDVLFKTIPSGFLYGFENVVSQPNQIEQSTDLNLDWSQVEITFYFIRGL